MSLAQDLIDAALAADLSKNELKTFLVLFRQTICYGKKSDLMTATRFDQLRAPRKDRRNEALKTLLDLKFFTVNTTKKHSPIYTLHERFFAKSEADFFVPSSPISVEKTRKSGKISPEIRVHTYKTNTTKTFTTTTDTPQRTKTESFTPPLQTDTEACSRSDFAIKEDLPYPSHWDNTQRSKAAQVLDGLSPQLARDCLLLLTHSLNKGKVTNPMGYLHTLVKAARANTLDRSPLTRHPQNAFKPVLSASGSNPIPNDTQQRLNDIKAEISGLDALFQRAGLPMDTTTAAKRASYVDEYNRLRGAMQ